MCIFQVCHSLPSYLLSSLLLFSRWPEEGLHNSLLVTSQQRSHPAIVEPKSAFKSENGSDETSPCEMLIGVLLELCGCVVGEVSEDCYAFFQNRIKSIQQEYGRTNVSAVDRSVCNKWLIAVC